MPRRRAPVGFPALVGLVASVASCGVFGSFDRFDTSPRLYAVGGTIDGLEGAQVTVLLAVNNVPGSTQTLGDGAFAFSGVASNGAGYVVTTPAAPPGHACTVEDGVGTIASADVASVAIHCPLTSDATLDGLTLSTALLSPAFAPAMQMYSATTAVASILPPPTTTTVTATAHDPLATIRIAGQPVMSGIPSQAIVVAPGPTPIDIDVTAGDQTTEQHYTVVVSGYPSDYIKASNTISDSFFSRSLALSGDTLAAGAYQEPSSATGVNGNESDDSAPGAGAVYVFTRTGTVWSQQAYIKASNTRASASFGYSVALSGDTLAVGSYGESSNATGVNGDQSDTSIPSAGAVYVFTRTGTVWSQQAYIKASNTASVPLVPAAFGSDVALSGTTLAVGAQGEASSATGIDGDQGDLSAAGAGAVYIFTTASGVWSQQAYIKASNTATLAQFGHALALSGNTLCVGAPGESGSSTGVNGDQSATSVAGSGAVYVFTSTSNVWSQQAYVKASNTRENAEFGAAVSVSGDTLAVGSPGESSNAIGVNGDQSNTSSIGSGAAYVFTRSAAMWSQQAYVKASNTVAQIQGDNETLFGCSVGVVGDTLAVGALGESSSATGLDGDQSNATAPRAGAVFVFGRSAAVWSQQAYVKASNTDAQAAFGSSLALTATALAVGAPGESSAATGIDGTSNAYAVSAGAAYVFP